MAQRWPQRHVTGSDIAEPYIAFARAQSSPGNLAFDVEDVMRLSYADGSFAGVAGQLVLNFVPNALEALTQMRRVTRSGGRIVAAVWDFRGGLTYQRIFWDTAAGIDPRAGTARDRLFSGSLALPDGLTTWFRASGRPSSNASSGARSPSAWIMRISTTTGARCAVDRGQSAPTSPHSNRTCARTSKKRSRPPSGRAPRTANAR
jgi:SAM-dependent methyltransferase